MRRTALVVLLLVSCGGGPSDVPCTMCPDVQGQYSEVSNSVTVTCMSGDMLMWTGVTDTVSLTQDGSSLTLTNSLGSVSGILHNDNSVSFQAQAAAATNLSNGTSEPGTLYITGQFSAAAPPSFGATYTFIRTSDLCRIEGTAEWTPE